MKNKNIVSVARNKKKLTQQDLAIKCGVSVKTIQAIEYGLRRPGSILAIKIFSILDIPLDDLENFLLSYTTK